MRTDNESPAFSVRPQILYPLFASVDTLPGVGPRLSKLFETLAGSRVLDLCWHLPSGLIDRRYSPKLGAAIPGRVATLEVTVGKHYQPHNKRQPYRVRCYDDTGEMDLVFFHARGDYLSKTLPEGTRRFLSGKLEIFSDRLQMTHPDHIGSIEDIGQVQRVEPVYPLTTGLTQNPVGKAVRAALDRAPDIPEWQDPNYRAQQDWTSWNQSLHRAHNPEDEQDLSPLSPARSRLAYDELLANQLALGLVRRRQRRRRGRSLHGDGNLRHKVLQKLPFHLTSSQETAIAEILEDMASPARMLRLLQGDVGSGKTLVAFMAALNAVEIGAQAAIMAPTEILARQHLATLEPLASAAGVGIALLTGRDKGKARAEKLGLIESGATSVVVGTHALFQSDVSFKDLALAVIDEQHRFGVHQRLGLTEKGDYCDVLVMTATPIPRTLVLTAYGDMESSRLTEKPPGRKPVDTRALPLERLGEVVEAVGRALREGRKVYWVCPLVAEPEVSDLAAAEERFQALSAIFGDRAALIHGRMKDVEKDAAMQRFLEGPIDLLVATTVIEVGVDVPAASVMVIEHAERFGLAQLHQLRGRIGRGDIGGTCLLLYQAPLGDTARARLRIMRETDDGFRIAEEDLRLRGAGELLGTRQSGFPEFRLAVLPGHDELLAAARDDAKLILEQDSELEGPRGEALRTLLYLFERDAAIRLLRSG